MGNKQCKTAWVIPGSVTTCNAFMSGEWEMVRHMSVPRTLTEKKDALVTFEDLSYDMPPVLDTAVVKTAITNAGLNDIDMSVPRLWFSSVETRSTISPVVNNLIVGIRRLSTNVVEVLLVIAGQHSADVAGRYAYGDATNRDPGQGCTGAFLTNVNAKSDCTSMPMIVLEGVKFTLSGSGSIVSYDVALRPKPSMPNSYWG